MYLIYQISYIFVERNQQLYLQFINIYIDIYILFNCNIIIKQCISIIIMLRPKKYCFPDKRQPYRSGTNEICLSKLGIWQKQQMPL